MASRTRRPRRLLLPAVLAAVLAGEITGIALGRSLPPVVVPVGAPAAALPAVIASAAQSTSRSRAGDAASEVVRIGVDLASRGATPGAATAGRALEARPRATTTRAGSSAAHASSNGGGHGGSPASYHGTNHVWIPSLGISKGIQSFPCSRSRPPNAGVYRWGCAGTNNVYLLAHAWSTFKPLHDAYVRGTLRKGMQVFYAGSDGHVHQYRVLWWKVTAPTTAASWAWAPLGSPGMTLQTCVGANSAYRLMVRLDRVD